LALLQHFHFVDWHMRLPRYLASPPRHDRWAEWSLLQWRK